MKIKYKKKNLYANLILGLVWLGLGTFSLIEEERIRWSDYGYLVIGALYLGLYLYNITFQYLTIEHGIVKKNSMFSKKINIDEITWIKKFAGDYILKTNTKELRINTNLIEERSLEDLNMILSKLNLPTEKTPFFTSNE